MAVRRGAAVAGGDKVKVRGLDGREHNLDLTGHVLLGGEQAGSSGHQRCRELLGELFPLDRLLEEVTLPGTGGLRADFFLPSRMLICEVDGRQHRDFIPHFHKTRLGFIQARKRDQDKKEWCVANNIRLCSLPDDESIAEWTVRIRQTDD